MILDSRSHASTLAAHAGGKAANLRRLERAGLPVPPWFALDGDVFRQYLEATGTRSAVEAWMAQALRDGGPVESRVADLLAAHPVPAPLAAPVVEAWKRLGATRVAVRSSALDEDGAHHSFAGQHASFLHVRTEAELLDCLVRCWASSCTDRVVAYRSRNGLPWRPDGLGVVVQVMVDSRASGVLFTCDPVAGSTSRHVLHAVHGLGEGYVGGALDPDTWELDARTGEILGHGHVEHTQAFESSGGGACEARDLPESLRGTSPLTPDEVASLHGFGVRIDREWSHPVDVEWAIGRDGTPWILQARPVTTPVEPGHGRLHVWDNSNIVESYGGLTLPLTFHFAHYMYHRVYVQFCEVLGVRADEIRGMDSWLRNMLGILQGRVYYNLLNWYKLTSLLPGYRFNRRFMETMMGTSTSLEAEIADRIRPPDFHQGWRGGWRRMRSGLRFALWHFRIQGVVDRFLEEFHRHHEPWARMEFRGMTADAILQHYHELERLMLWRWKAPIINDYLCMVHFGVFKALTARWLGHLGDTFHNDLMAGDGNLESTAPARDLMRMARKAREDAGLVDLLLKTDDARCLEVLRQSDWQEFHAEVVSHLDRFGFRCMSEMKLEQRDLHQDPAQLFAFLRNLLRCPPQALDPSGSREREVRLQAETLVDRELPWWKRIVYRWSLHHARKAVRNRESTRFCRTRIYGIVRRMFWAMGDDFVLRRLLGAPGDIFYLTLEELKGTLEGTCSTTDLAGLVALRKREYEGYAAVEPHSRLVTRGPVQRAVVASLASTPAPTAPPAEGRLQGKGCCPGIVEGVVKVVQGPQDDLALAGEILVCTRTDPGWIPLYPSISGLLVERGGLLSHSAIVAREMGLPTIVGLDGLCATLRTGMRVRMDGQLGTVEIL